MERVKPIYLSRTYGLPLPDPNDPTKNWEPEVLLDRLARMKGRLLKHGEPDLEAIAKILLSDWVRGRIPYFVPPPERSEELNRLEAKKQKSKEQAVRSKEKAKAKEVEGMQVPGVKQNLGSIMQKNTFVPEDVRPLDEEFAAEGDESIDVEESDEGKSDAPEEEELTWNDVFEGINEVKIPVTNGDDGDLQPEGEHICYAK